MTLGLLAPACGGGQHAGGAHQAQWPKTGVQLGRQWGPE
jgi:hypothetical protein